MQSAYYKLLVESALACVTAAGWIELRSQMLRGIHAALRAESADAKHQILMRNNSWLETTYQCTNEGESLPEDLTCDPLAFVVLSLAC